MGAKQKRKQGTESIKVKVCIEDSSFHEGDKNRQNLDSHLKHWWCKDSISHTMRLPSSIIGEPLQYPGALTVAHNYFFLASGKGKHRYGVYSLLAGPAL